MKIGFAWAAQAQGQEGIDTGPTAVESSHQGWFTWDTFKKVISAIVAGYETEHNPDDTHKTIHATGTIAERARTVPMGNWIEMPFTASDYTTDNGTAWTVAISNIQVARYMLIGATLFLNLRIINTTLAAGAPSALRLQLPNNFTVASDALSLVRLTDNGAFSAGYCQVTQPSLKNRLQFIRIDSSVFTASAGATGVEGLIIVELAGQA